MRYQANLAPSQYSTFFLPFPNDHFDLLQCHRMQRNTEPTGGRRDAWQLCRKGKITGLHILTNDNVLQMPKNCCRRGMFALSKLPTFIRTLSQVISTIERKHDLMDMGDQLPLLLDHNIYN